jgi:hypothetical protein
MGHIALANMEVVHVHITAAEQTGCKKLAISGNFAPLVHIYGKHNIFTEVNYCRD